MTKIQTFVRKEWVYIVLVMFILSLNIFALGAGWIKTFFAQTKSAASTVETKVTRTTEGKELELLFRDKKHIEKIFEQNKNIALLFGMVSLLVLALLAMAILFTLR